MKVGPLNMTLDLRDVHLGQNQRPLQESSLTVYSDGISVARFLASDSGI